MWDRPIGEFTEIEYVNKQTYRFHKLSRARSAFGLFVCCMRFAIAGNMLICGMFFLAYTIELSRLLLAWWEQKRRHLPQLEPHAHKPTREQPVQRRRLQQLGLSKRG